MTPFGECLGALRRSRRLMQKQIAGLLGVSPGYVSAFEKGAKPLPSREILERLAAALVLTREEEQAFWESVELSSLNIQVAEGMSRQELEFLCRLKEHLGSLCEEQLAIMDMALHVTSKRSIFGRNPAMT